MKLSKIFFNSSLDIKSFSTSQIDDTITSDIFTLETENDDYYIFERLESRLRFEIPEITEITLLEIN